MCIFRCKTGISETVRDMAKVTINYLYCGVRPFRLYKNHWPWM